MRSVLGHRPPIDMHTIISGCMCEYRFGAAMAYPLARSSDKLRYAVRTMHVDLIARYAQSATLQI